MCQAYEAEARGIAAEDVLARLRGFWTAYMGGTLADNPYKGKRHCYADDQSRAWEYHFSLVEKREFGWPAQNDVIRTKGYDELSRVVRVFAKTGKLPKYLVKIGCWHSDHAEAK